MASWIKNVLGITAIGAIASVAVFVCILCWQWSRTGAELERSASAVTASTGGLQPAIQSLNAGAAQWSSASKAQADSVTAIERDVRVEMWQLDRTLQSVDGTLQTAQGAIGGVKATVSTANGQLAHVGPLLDSLKASSDSIPPTMATLRETSGQATADLASLNDILRDRAIHETFANVADMTGTASQLENHFAKPYLHPSKSVVKRIWQQSEPFLVGGAKVVSVLF